MYGGDPAGGHGSKMLALGRGNTAEAIVDIGFEHDLGTNRRTVDVIGTT